MTYLEEARKIVGCYYNDVLIMRHCPGFFIEGAPNIVSCCEDCITCWNKEADDESN